MYRQLLLQPENPETIEASKVALVAKCVSTSNPVVIKSLDKSTIIIYGCDPSEEGAHVFIYDINYDLILSKQSLKLYGSPPIMERVGMNVFVPVGLNILVLGLRVTKSLLSTALGRHQLQSVDFFETRNPWVKDWDTESNSGIEAPEVENETNGVSSDVAEFSDLVKLVHTLENSGQPQSM